MAPVRQIHTLALHPSIFSSASEQYTSGFARLELAHVRWRKAWSGLFRSSAAGEELTIQVSASLVSAILRLMRTDLIPGTADQRSFRSCPYGRTP